MTSNRGAPRGGPVRATPGQAGPFAALVRRAAEEPEAAGGLALGYATLEPAARRELVDAVAHDAAVEAVPPARVLVHLLSVEDDVEVARAIATIIEASGDALPPLRAAEAQLGGDDSTGGALLVQPLHQDFVEVLALGWEQGRLTGTRFEPMLRREQSGRARSAWPAGIQAAPVSFRDAADRLAPVLWHHLREGHPVPSGLARFAGWFGV